MKLDYDMMEITLKELKRLSDSSRPCETDYQRGYRDALEVVGSLVNFVLTLEARDMEEKEFEEF